MAYGTAWGLHSVFRSVTSDKSKFKVALGEPFNPTTKEVLAFIVLPNEEARYKLLFAEEE